MRENGRVGKSINLDYLQFIIYTQIHTITRRAERAHQTLVANAGAISNFKCVS